MSPFRDTNTPNAAARTLRSCRTQLLVAALAAVVSSVANYAAAAAEPVPSAVPPNASRVTAIVRNHKVWPPGALGNAEPIVAPDARFWSVQLELLTAMEGERGAAHLAEPSRTVEAFSDQPISADLVGKRIAATLTLTGSTTGARWMIKDFNGLP